MVNLMKQDFNFNKNKFENIKNDLRKEINDSIPIDHVGSTAIENIEYGKNIIDILIGAKNIEEFNFLTNILLNNGYYSSGKTDTEIYKFFASSEEETKSGDVHIHLAILKTDRYNEFLILRDYLKNNKKEAIEYSKFKEKLISNGIVDRKEYRNTKSEYVSKLINRAKAFSLSNKN